MQKEIRARLDSLPKTEASFVEPMECLSVSKLPAGLEWLWEIKLDGYRALAVKSGNGVTLFSRRRKSLNRQFPYIVEALAVLPAGTVVDGEVVAIDESGRPDFNLLQNFRAEASRIQYYIFDLLCWKDRDLTRVPMVERRKLLKSVVPARTLQGRSSQFDVLIRRSDASGNSAPRTLPMHKVELRRQVGALVPGKNTRGFSRHAGVYSSDVGRSVKEEAARDSSCFLPRCPHRLE